MTKEPFACAQYETHLCNERAEAKPVICQYKGLCDGMLEWMKMKIGIPNACSPSVVNACQSHLLPLAPTFFFLSLEMSN